MNRRMFSALLGLGFLTTMSCQSQQPATPNDGDLMAAHSRMIEQLRRSGAVQDMRVLGAIDRVPRHLFVRGQDLDRAYDNVALPIEDDQTISQPLMVARMTQLLELKGTEKVLEIGTGSGYQAAILSLLAKDVYSIEIDPQLSQSARERLQRLGYGNVHLRAGDGFYGWQEAGPFDAIIVTADAPRLPERLFAQLKPTGRMILPMVQGDKEILARVTSDHGKPKIEELGPAAFVPMRGAIEAPTAPAR